MRFLVIFFIGFLTTLTGFAQAGDEWINFNQQYFRIPVGRDGLYRISHASLQAAGLSPAADPRNFKLYHRGTQQAITVAGESDGSFSGGDYVEFFGRKNDGTLDTELYNSAASQPHTLYNLYNDTTSYFLTYGAGTGKRIPLVNASTGVAAESYHLDERLLLLNGYYSKGVDYGDIQATVFDRGEGWMAEVRSGNPGTYVVEGITNGATAVGPPSLEILLTAIGPANYTVQLYAGGRLLASPTVQNYGTYKHVQALQWSDVVGGKITVEVKSVGTAHVGVGYIKVQYPQQVNMASATEKAFMLAEKADNISYINISNTPASTRLYDVTDPANVTQLTTVLEGTLNAVVPGTTSRKLWATNTPITATVKRVAFRSIDPAAHNFVIVTHPSLRKPSLGYTDPVKAYAEYRALPQGGGYDTLIVNIRQLYDQYSYGETTPLAIFRFARFLASVKLPDYLFIIGKGLDINTAYYRNSPLTFPIYKDLVPTAGYPGSDMAYSAGLDGASNGNGIATGRLTAAAPQDVAAYFNKVKEHEARPFDDLRRKNILHLSGGIHAQEPAIFRSYLEGFAEIAKGFQYGAQIRAIGKQTTNIEVINVADEVNKGVNMITFFGHSSAASSDFDIGYATDPVMGYNNKGKYPVMLMNGCSAGSFFLNASIFGENWVNSPNRGAIAIIAHTYLGFSFSLRSYSSMFYEVGYGDEQFIKKGLGDIQKEVARRYLATFGPSPEVITQVQQMVLLGDPSVKLFGAGYADYEIEEESIGITAFDGAPITALTDSFKLNFVVRNYGHAKNTNLRISVQRTLNDGSMLVYDSVFSPVLYSDTISFTVPGKIDNGFGNNVFSISVDAGNDVEEIREDNNKASRNFFIPLNGTQNLFPDRYAIVNTRQVNLSWQHTDLLSAEREFVMEFDSVSTFDSNFRQQYTVKGTVLALQPVNLPDKDTVAYYWRTKLATVLPDENPEWEVSSFTYINNGPEGWAQVRFPQYSENDLQGLVLDPQAKRMTFKETTTNLAIKTFTPALNYPTDSVSVRINGAEYNLVAEGTGSFTCRNNTINLIAFDRKTTQPYPGIYFTWTELNTIYGGKRLICGREPYVINSFLYNELVAGNNGDLVKYVDNIPAGDSVVLFNIGDAGFTNWSAAARSKLGELGISVAQLTALQAGEPVVIFARKGAAAGTAKIFRDAVSPAGTKKVKINETVTGRATAGAMTSVVVGPARQWHKFITKYTEKGSTDEVLFDIEGITLQGEKASLFTDLTGTHDISGIDATAYPYLRLSFRAADPTFVTAVQLSKWLVTYDPVAEGFLLYNGPREQQSLPEGITWRGSYSFVNIGAKAFDDSLTVKYDIVNPQTFASSDKVMKVAAPLPGDTTRFDVSFSTLGQQGINNAEVFVNPKILAEQRYENNVIVLHKHLNIVPDTEAPVLDVTFDGRHIVDDEYISASPHIRITVWDNNQQLLKKDTANVAIFLSAACDADDVCLMKAVYFSQPGVQWYAETDTTEFTVTYNPQGLPDGTYVFRATARDAKGNMSGAEPYQISFRVKHEAGAAVLNPYPNPFYHKTNFSFILTGESMPSAFGLQILTLNGQVVQSFTERDVPGFHTGTNTISWPGLDAAGTPLPNGIYLYRLMLQLDGEVITSKGKVVLIR